MTNDKGIFIKNIYYMLSYAFQILKQSNYENVAAEEFDKVQDLFAAILAKGVAKQLKQGLYREYVTQHETLSVMRGKLDMTETIKNRFALHYFLSQVGRMQIKERAVSTSGLHTLSTGKIESLRIPLPPLDLQNRFADFARHVNASKLAIQQSLDETQRLFDSLMAEYFED